jgi:phenylalanyl-tRNA synthetase beta chain
MRTSLQWLRSYTDCDRPPEEIAQSLTMAGLEVESMEQLGKVYDGFIAGKVTRVEKHPAADTLTVCSVFTGTETFQVVCGAPNVAPEQMVVLGLPGAEVPHDQHSPQGSPFVLKKTSIRGVESNGMICSGYELGLDDDKEGILVLRPDAKPGLQLAEYLGLDDFVFEIGVTPNRPDALSHIGVAREVAAITGLKLEIPKIRFVESQREASRWATIQIDDTAGCPRYTARLLFGVKVGPSPVWMQRLLGNVGIRPINNIVDVTNYVLMEIGHPLHAFDYDRIGGHTIIVRRASGGERFTTLDGKERVLTAENLMINDANGPVAIAGVMGGSNSEISDSTVNVLLESAYFDPRSIRRTSKTFGLSTEASQRFERGADPGITEWAVNRASALIQQFTRCEILKDAIDVYPVKQVPRKVSLRIQRMNEILGTTLKETNVKRLLGKIGILPVAGSTKKGTVSFNVPTFRPDIEQEIDLVEEVARLHGYDRIEVDARTTLRFSERAPETDISDMLRGWLVGRGFHEIITNSMEERSLAAYGSQNVIEVKNPISVEMSTMRTSLIPSILRVVRENLFHGVKDIRIFEMGKIYLSAPGTERKGCLKGYIEENRLILAMSGMALPVDFNAKTRLLDLFDLKGELEDLFEKIFLDKIKFIPYPTTKALTQDEISIDIYGERAGYLGKADPKVLRLFEIEQEVLIADISLEALEKNIERRRRYKALAKYPQVMRDMAVVVDESLSVGELTEEIRRTAGGLLASIGLFDIYRGDQITAGKKSCAFALEFQAADRTLSQEEVEKVLRQIIRNVSNKFNATLRM